MTTAIVSDRDTVCDSLKLPYSIGDDILFDAIQKKFIQLDNENDDLRSDLNIAEDERDTAKDKLKKAKSEIVELETEISDLRTDKWNLEEEIRHLQDK